MSNTPITRTQPSTTVDSLPSAGIPDTAASLLVPPASLSPLDTTDAITQLLKFSSDLSAQQMQLGKGEVAATDAQRKVAARERKEALDRAVEAARKAREAADDGIFSSISNNIGLTGLVGLTTFNFSLVAADVAAHRAGLTDGKTGLADLGIVAGSPLLYLAEKGLEKIAPDAMNSTAFAAMFLGGPAGYAIERAAEKLTPDDLEKSLAKISTVKDNDVRAANKVAVMAAVIAVVATSSVLSAGTSTPALVLALSGVGISTATQVGAQTGLTQTLFGDKAAGYVTVGGAIVGAALSLGGAVCDAASAAQAVDSAKNVATTSVKGSQILANAQKITTAKNVTDSLEKARAVVSATTSITQGAASIENGVIGLNVAGHQRDADSADADAQQARNALARLEQMIDAVLADLQDANDASRKSTELLQQTLQTSDQTLVIAASMKA